MTTAAGIASRPEALPGDGAVDHTSQRVDRATTGHRGTARAVVGARRRCRRWEELRRVLEDVVRRDYPTLTRLVPDPVLSEVVGGAVADCLFAGHRLSDRTLIRSLRDAIEAGLAAALDVQAMQKGWV